MQEVNGDAVVHPPSPQPQQQTQQNEKADSSAFRLSSSKRFLLASTKKRESGEDDTNGTKKRENGEDTNGRPVGDVSIVVPQSSSHENLVASGALQWNHILFSPIKSFQSIRESRELKSLETPSSGPSSLREGLSLPLVGEIRWEDLSKSIKAWLRNPKNLALLLWGIAVGVSGAMLFLIMVGFLDHAIRSKSQRDAWFEANNQILNALFTLMCLYLHPQRLLHLYYLHRWQPQDIKKLRDTYCKDGTYKPHEWSSMLMVVLLLNLNCFAQYALCGLNWGYRRSDRPVVGVGLCLAVAMGAAAAAGIYAILSPLGKDYEEDEEHLTERVEMEDAQEKKLNNKRSIKIGKGWKRPSKFCLFERDGKLIKEPVWRGGLFDIRSDPQVTCYTLFCGFCVFGWNMQRLGFGNRFVHIVTFILLCTAPYWIFFLAATNIDNWYVRTGLSYGGIILCVFGLLYGGFWRMQMRKTYGLPAQRWCCGVAALTDCTQWLFCSLCSLCQEVRTSETYKIYNGRFYERYTSPSPSDGSSLNGQSPLGENFASTTVMTPPAAPFIKRELSTLPEVVEHPVENEESWTRPPLGMTAS